MADKSQSDSMKTVPNESFRTAPLAPPPKTAGNNDHRQKKTPPAKKMTDDAVLVNFQRADQDGDGHISAQELQDLLKNGLECPFNPATVSLMMGMFDTNMDGGIDFEEFKALHAYVMTWSDAFRRFDRDENLTIETYELQVALTSFGFRVPQSVGEILVKNFDRTRTGKLYFDDFIQACIFMYLLDSTFRSRDVAGSGMFTITYDDFIVLVLQLMLRAEFNRDSFTQ